MHSRTLRAAFAALVLSAISLTATVCAPGVGMYVQTGPPLPPAEVIAVQPGPEYLWVPGYYDYAGGSYVWVSGRWAVPPHGYHAWVPARWVHEDKGWRFEKGHWRS